MKDNLPKAILIRGFGNSGAGAVIDWLLDTKQFHLPKFQRLEEIGNHYPNFSITFYLSNTNIGLKNNIIQLVLVRSLFIATLKIPIRFILFRLLPKKVSRIHYSHSVEYSLKSILNNLHYTFVFYNNLNPETFKKWIYSKFNGYIGDKPIILDQGLPGYSAGLINDFISNSFDFIGMIVYRDPIKMLVERAKTEKTLINSLLTGEEFDPSYFENTQILMKIDVVLGWYEDYLELLKHSPNVIPVNFDSFIHSYNYRERIASFLNIKKLNLSISHYFNPKQSVLNDDNLASEINRINLTNEAKEKIQKMLSYHSLFENFFEERVTQM